MDNIFTADTGKSLFYKRFIRLSQFTRLPLRLSLSLMKYYFKKMLGAKGTARETANNYYFLTLINSQSQHKKSEGELFCFQNYSGFSFYARQNPSSDLEVFNQVWGRKEYHYATGKLKETISKDTAVHIIDAGANVGYSTLFFLQEFPNARIVSIEPDTDNFAVLEKNIASNNLGGQVIPEKKGVWNKTCNLKVVDTFRDGFSWSKQVVETTESTGLQAVSLSAIIEKQQWPAIDLLKIDIEGSEKQVFDDEEGLEKFLPITKVIALEIHDEVADRKKIYETLTRYGFTHFDIEGSDLTIAYNPRQLV